MTEGAPPRRFWLLEVGVVGVRASEVLWLSGREEGARPVGKRTRTTSAHFRATRRKTFSQLQARINFENQTVKSYLTITVLPYNLNY